MRSYITLPDDPVLFGQLKSFASQRKVSCVLGSNMGHDNPVDIYSELDWCVAFDAADNIIGGDSFFDSLKEFHTKKKDWLFGFMTYDLKNQLEELTSSNNDGLKFPSGYFFQPRYLFIKKGDKVQAGFLSSHDDENSLKVLLNEINHHPLDNLRTISMIDPTPSVSREKYISTVSEIKAHIQRGDIYEMNYCTEFYADKAKVHPLSLYENLNKISPMPFSCYFRHKEHYLVCASPERFIAKRGSKIISQPIKGTARRGNTKEEDEFTIEKLRNDEKEKSENVMIVDLVRNDLSRTAKRKSVHVEELFGIYSFPRLHHAISTVVSEMKDDVDWTDVIRCAFPMGSMTGAPKIRAMELIEEFENTKRGLYSGSVGYITPEGDFDFNVVIRSILYNELENYISFMVGSAITINSDPGKEYDECLLKAEAMMKVLKNSIPEKANH